MSERGEQKYYMKEQEFSDDQSASSEDFQELYCDKQTQVESTPIDMCSQTQAQEGELLLAQYAKNIYQELLQTKKEKEFIREEQAKMLITTHNQAMRIQKLNDENAEMISQIKMLSAENMNSRTIIEKSKQEIKQLFEKIAYLEETIEHKNQKNRELASIVEHIVGQGDEKKLAEMSKRTKNYISKMQELFEKIDSFFVQNKEELANSNFSPTLAAKIDDKIDALERIRKLLKQQKEKLAIQKQNIAEINKKLEEFRHQSKGKEASTFSRWLDPIMKFYKLEEDRPESKQKKQPI